MESVYCYHLVDKHGTRRDIVTTHEEETVEVEGLIGHRHKAIYFEGKAIHLDDWAYENDVTLEQFEVQIDLEKKEVRVA